jgi:hypothetical protein
MKDDTTGKYRTMLDGLQKTAREIVMDEIKGDVNRLLEYSESIDTSDAAGMVVGLETIVCALKELARKVY